MGFGGSGGAWGARSKHVGQRLGAGFTGSWSPRLVAGTVLWVPASTTHTFGGMTVPVGAGTTPPAVTVSGTPAAGVTGLLVRTPTTGGARGTALFDWSTDNGTTYTVGVTTAASVVLGATGLTVAFAVGTYNTDNTYTSYPSASQSNDQSGSANHILQATQTKQWGVKPAAINGLAAFLSTSVTDMATAASSLGAATDFTFVCIAGPTSITGGAATTGPISTVGGTYGNITMAWSTPADGRFFPGTDQTNRVDTATTYITASNQILTLVKSGAASGNLTTYRNGVNAKVNTGLTAVAPTAGAHRFANFNGTGIGGLFAEPWILNRAATPLELTLVHQYYSRKYGIALA